VAAADGTALVEDLPLHPIVRAREERHRRAPARGRVADEVDLVLVDQDGALPRGDRGLRNDPNGLLVPLALVVLERSLDGNEHVGGVRAGIRGVPWVGSDLAVDAPLQRLKLGIEL